MAEKVRNLSAEEIQERLQNLPGWEKAPEGQKIERTFKFPDFLTALAFVNKVGEKAEKQGHHPDVFLTWGKVRLQSCTHSSGGLTAKDFELASDINKAYDPQ